LLREERSAHFPSSQKCQADVSVIPAGPPSPSSSTGDLTPKGERYYRPSTQIIINHLKRKVDHFAAPDQYEKFDHLVRGLGRDGLLETSANTELVERMFPSSVSTILIDDVVARLKGSIEHLAQYLPSTILAALNEQYE
jgi:ribonuclease H2 subunit B